MNHFGRSLPTRDVAIGPEKFEKMADGITRMSGQEDGKVPGPRPMGRADILEIFRCSL